jgi:glycosyltransferase involved in cell wall biosynthesis
MENFTTPWGKKLGRKLRIFGLPWHIAHQYELLKLPETEWTFLTNYTRKWSNTARPMPDHLNWVTHFDPKQYDMVLLHVDQQCVYEPIGKGRLFRGLRDQVKEAGIPAILINHGTPYWPEMYSTKDIVLKMAEMVGDLKDHTVVNSERAREMWGFGRFIRHGMDPQEWVDEPKENRIFTTISSGGLDKYYNRQLLRAVQELLRTEHDIKMCHVGVDWQAKSWDDYKRFIGSSLIYFNPTLESPMPRARTEAMLSGACVVTLKNHDIDNYIEDGVSGYFVKNNPHSVVKKLVELFEDYETAIKVGQAGKQVALQHFTNDKFVEQWTEMISDTLGL